MKSAMNPPPCLSITCCNCHMDPYHVQFWYLWF